MLNKKHLYFIFLAGFSGIFSAENKSLDDIDIIRNNGKLRYIENSNHTIYIELLEDKQVFATFFKEVEKYEINAKIFHGFWQSEWIQAEGDSKKAYEIFMKIKKQFDSAQE